MRNKKLFTKYAVNSQKSCLLSFLPRGRKGVVDKVFIYVFSIIIIGFAGLLVGKFVFTFSDDTDLRLQTEFYNKLDKDYNLIYKTYGAEKILQYKVHQDVKYVCFIPKVNCIDKINISSQIVNYDLDSLMTLVNSGDNIVMYDKDDVMNSYKLGYFNSDGSNDCFCVKPNLGRFDLIMGNLKNKVYISVGE